MSSRQESGQPKEHVRDEEGALQTEVVSLPEIPAPHSLSDTVPHCLTTLRFTSVSPTEQMRSSGG